MLEFLSNMSTPTAAVIIVTVICLTMYLMVRRVQDTTEAERRSGDYLEAAAEFREAALDYRAAADKYLEAIAGEREQRGSGLLRVPHSPAAGSPSSRGPLG